MRRAGASKAWSSLLHERALLEGRDFGLRIEPTAYEFVVYDPVRDRWLTLTDEHEFRHRDLPEGVTFQLELDSTPVVLKAHRPDVSRATSRRPRPRWRSRRAAKERRFA